MNPDDGGYGYDGDRPDRRRQKKNQQSTILLIAAAVLVLIGAILIGRTMVGDDTPDQATVPNFVGDTRTAAEQSAQNAGLKLSFTEKPCEDQEKGLVCSQDPAAKSKLDKGATVALVLSTGLPKVEVPDVVGMSEDDATAKLEEAGFEVVVDTEVNASATEGEVLDQSPGDGSEREKGSEVTIKVAKQPQKVNVPNVMGMSCDEAVQRLKQDGLDGNCSGEEPVQDDSRVDKVAWMSFQPGETVDVGTPIQMRVGKKQETQQPLPDVRNMPLKDARKALEDAGYKNIAPTQDNPNGTVVQQLPPPTGQPVDPNTQIILLVQ